MPTYTFATLNDPAATDGTTPEGINDSGQIVGTYTGSDNAVHGFLYSAGAYTALTDPSATGAYAGTFSRAINDSCQIVGSYADANRLRHAFIYDSSTGSFSKFDEPSATYGTF